MRIFSALILMVFSTSLLFSQDFKSVPAKNAISKYNAELKKVEDIKIAAEKQLKKDLTESINLALKNEDLDEANRIKALVDGKVKLSDIGSKVEEKQVPPKNKLVPDEEPKKEEKVGDIKITGLKLSDEHVGQISMGKNLKDDKYTLTLKKADSKRITLKIEGEFKNMGMPIVVGVYVNKGLVGYWPMHNPNDKPIKDSGKQAIEFDITSKIHSEELNDYEISFKCMPGIHVLVTEVKAEYK